MATPKETLDFCPKCDGVLVLDDTSRLVYCERNPDHFRFTLNETWEITRSQTKPHTQEPS